jgi:hypothetical protein
VGFRYEGWVLGLYPQRCIGHEMSEHPALVALKRVELAAALKTLQPAADLDSGNRPAKARDAEIAATALLVRWQENAGQRAALYQ